MVLNSAIRNLLVHIWWIEFPYELICLYNCGNLDGLRTGMTTLALAFIGMLIVVAIMAVGVLFGRKPIAGSCGGIAQLGLGGECQICGKKPQDCPNDSNQQSASQNDIARLAYNAERTSSDPVKPRASD
jgi:hypothetical protein